MQKRLEMLWFTEAIANQKRKSACPDVDAPFGKSYGSGALKVEPRALERLPLSPSALALSGLCSSGMKAMTSKCAEQPFLPLG